jgi:predicted Kef-type K+ transport protein
VDIFTSTLDIHQPLWILIAFSFGLIFQKFKLPAMLGFLLAGFVLHFFGAQDSGLLKSIADLGVTLLLFTIGLKLHLNSLLKPEIWATTLSHMSITVILAVSIVLSAGAMGLSIFSGIDLRTAAIIAFALSFSSTVFAIKSLEERGALSSRYGQIAIGILVIQDIAAVIFLAFSTGKMPTIWAIGLLLLIPSRPLLTRILSLSGHKELLTLCGFAMALGGAALFESVGMKGDLGALIMGVLLTNHAKSNELSKTLLSFKDAFLVCFFLTIGLTGLPTLQTLGAALLLMLVIPLKMVLFYLLLTRFRVRAQGSTLATLTLGNFSEFGLIVIAVAISAGWLETQWLTVMALALSLSFIIASPFSRIADNFYNRVQTFLKQFETPIRLEGDEDIDISDHTILVFGMGRVGRSVYDKVQAEHDLKILGVDQDPEQVEKLCATDRNIILGDATNPEFWSRIGGAHNKIHWLCSRKLLLYCIHEQLNRICS